MLPLNNNQITSAFETLCTALDQTGGGAELPWGKLKEMLVSEGESIAPGDLESYMAALMGANASALLGNGNILFNPRSFADEVLGFES